MKAIQYPNPINQRLLDGLFEKFREQQAFYITSTGNWYLSDLDARKEAILLKDSSIYVYCRK